MCVVHSMVPDSNPHVPDTARNAASTRHNQAETDPPVCSLPSPSSFSAESLQVAEAKAAGVPVQIAVARSVTDVQQKVPLNPQVSRKGPNVPFHFGSFLNSSAPSTGHDCMRALLGACTCVCGPPAASIGHVCMLYAASWPNTVEHYAHCLWNSILLGLLFCFVQPNVRADP